jgi:MOSC domain-containing protein YiiM
MSKVFEIGIADNRSDKMLKVEAVEAIMGKGLINDRHFKENNEKKNQVTLIEIENITYYNKISKSDIKPIDFRRNIITEGINLNNLVNKKFSIGEVNLMGIDLCTPCKYLQEKLKQSNFIKELLLKGGLRCEVLSNGKIYNNDKIKF